MDDFKKKFNTNKKELNEDVISQIVNNAEVINKIYKEKEKNSQKFLKNINNDEPINTFFEEFFSISIFLL